MKRRSLVISLLLVAALALGIGYAAFTVNMEIGGDVSVGAPAPAVTFSAVSEQVTKGGITSGNDFGKNALGGQSIDLNVGGFSNAGDEVVVTYTVKNDHDFPVTVTTPAVQYTNTGDNYDTNISIVSSTWTGLDGSGHIPANGGTATFTVTVTLAKSFATDASITQNFKVVFTATGVAGTP
jgi:LEA14-like dessication related protein